MQEVLKFLWCSIKNYRGYYFLMLCAPICGALYEPMVYYAIKLMVDIISGSANLTFRQLLTPLAIYLTADILVSVVWRISQIALWHSEPYVQQGIVLNAIHKVFAYRYSFFQNTSTGGVVSKIKGVLDGYTDLWEQLYSGVSFWLLASIAAGASIFLISPKLGVVIVIWSSAYIAINYRLAYRINHYSEELNTDKHQVMSELADTLTNIHNVKLFAKRKDEEARLKKDIANGFIAKSIKLHKFNFKVDILNDLLAIMVIVAMILIMIKLRALHQLSVGDFVFVFGMMFQFQENLWHLMQEFHQLSDIMGDLKSSLTIQSADLDEFQMSKAKSDLAQLMKLDGGSGKLPDSDLPRIEFRNIDFSYSEGKAVFNNLNLQIKAGEKVGIVGYTGAGKTTLINLLLKMFIPSSGQILINGVDSADIDSDELRKMISIIPQDISLFNRSLLDNIRYGNSAASELEVVEACRKAHADEFIQQLPMQYATIVGERGIKLSGGQRQRIAIARAILKVTPILVLDEATSSLDGITEQQIQTSLKQLLAGKTVLAIAHRLSTLKAMDRIIVIDQGAIVASGTHEELLARENSVYARIWRSQYE